MITILLFLTATAGFYFLCLNMFSFNAAIRKYRHYRDLAENAKSNLELRHIRNEVKYEASQWKGHVVFLSLAWHLQCVIDEITLGKKK